MIRQTKLGDRASKVEGKQELEKRRDTLTDKADKVISDEKKDASENNHTNKITEENRATKKEELAPKKDKGIIKEGKGTSKRDKRIKAFDLAEKQREISVAEFFEKNRHLLGFDNKRKALLTTVKEALDNALDACEEAGVLPDINVEISQLSSEDRFRVIVEDNGPGIVKQQIPKIFGKLLYGSKFHSLKQSRGQQGIGISAAALYAQLTTGKPIKIESRISEKYPVSYFEIHIDTTHNKPEIINSEQRTNWKKPHGTKVEVEIEASYQKGDQSVDEYLKETAIINPYATITYTSPKSEQQIFVRTVNKLPVAPKEIKPHPYGLELGILFKMLKSTKSKTLHSFLMSEFSRVGSQTAKEICEKAGLLTKQKPHNLTRQDADRIIHAIRKTKIISPPTDCLSPIGAKELEEGLRKEINAEFYASTQRPPSVYRGNPFIIECAIAYGGSLPADKQINLLRFANKVPLLYQKGGCAITKTVSSINWRNYGLQQSRGSLPQGPVVLAVHFASVWAPFTSEAKEAIAHYPEIMREIKLAVQDCARQMYSYIRKKRRVRDALKKKGYIEKYIPHIAEALINLLELDNNKRAEIETDLREILEKTRKVEKIENVEHTPDEEKLGIVGNVEDELDNFEDEIKENKKDTEKNAKTINTNKK